MKQAYDYAEKAKTADKASNWRDAERYYLLAAQALATSQLAADKKNRELYDRAAKRAHRLGQLEVSA